MDATKVTTWPNALSKRHDRAEVAIATVIEEIKSGKYAAQVTELRAILATGDIKKYNAEKIFLTAFTAAGTFSRRHHADCHLKHSGVLPIDLDKLSPSHLSGLLAQFLIDPYVCYCFVSPSGTGIKCGIRIVAKIPDVCFGMARSDGSLLEVDPAHHLAGFFSAQAYFRDTYKVEIDPACKDVSRLTFVSHDPGAWYKSGTPELPITDVAKAAATSYLSGQKVETTKKKSKTPSPPATLTTPALQMNAVAGSQVDPALLAWLLRPCVATSIGNNNRMVHNLARRCVGHGLTNAPLTEAQKQTVFDAWFTASQTSGSDGSSVLQDSYDDYHSKFDIAFGEGKVKRPCKDIVLEEFKAVQKAIQNGSYQMPSPAEKYTDSKWKLAIALAHSLAVRNGEKPFILACSDLSRVLGISRSVAGDILKGLIHRDILRIHTKHTEFVARRLLFVNK